MPAPTSRSTISRISRSCSWAERPSALRSATDASSCSCRPETRIMKNSSRFEWKIARNLTRSKSGQARTQRFFENPAIEREPGDLAIEIERTVVQPVFRRLTPTDVMDFAHTVETSREGTIGRLSECKVGPALRRKFCLRKALRGLRRRHRYGVLEPEGEPPHRGVLEPAWPLRQRTPTLHFLLTTSTEASSGSLSRPRARREPRRSPRPGAAGRRREPCAGEPRDAGSSPSGDGHSVTPSL